jgi:hypothetical protein
MLLAGLFSWWYSDGLLGCIENFKKQLASLSDLFSIELMFRTLFMPFRQISANATGVSLDDKVRAFFDRLLSKIIGAFTRTFMIIIGLIVMLGYTIIGICSVVLWIVIPAMPIIGMIGCILS